MGGRFLGLFNSRKKDGKQNIIRLVQNEPIDSSLISESDADKLYVLNSLGNKRVLENALTLLKVFRQHHHFNYDKVSINGRYYWEIMRFA